MLKNNLKIAWRNIQKHRIYSFINISGLAIGLGCVSLIALFIQDELNYDTFFKDVDQIYRVNIDGKMGDDSFYAGYTPPPAGKALVDNFPEIEGYTRIYKPNKSVMEVKTGNEQRLFNEANVYAVDSNFLELLSYPLLKGDPATCLKELNSIVITTRTAQKYFGTTDAMGKTMLYGRDKRPLRVTGVLKDMSQLKATVKFDMLVPVENFEEVAYFDWSWVWLNMATYVKLSDKAASNPNIQARLEQKFPEMLRVQAAPGFKRIGQPFDKFLENGNYWNLHLQSLRDIHLRSGEIVSSISDQADIKNLYILGLIAIFIILLACVNFTNLATARASKRSKEVGVRKVLGSARKQLIRQFLTEAFLYTLISAVLGMILIVVFLPLLNSLTGKSISLLTLFYSNIWLIILGLIVLTAFLAGIYPAFYITAFKPVQVLKGSVSAGKKSLLRNGLVVFQFAIAIFMVISTLIVYTQLRYTQKRDLGYDKENLLIIENTGSLRDSEETFRDQLAGLPQVASATSSTSIFTKGAFGDFYVPQTTEPGQQVAKDISLNSYLVDEHFINTLKIDLKAGRAFDSKFNDSLSVVINEVAAKQIGWKNPIGQKIRYPGGQMEYYTVIGVVEDFNLESLHQSITPFALFSKTSQSYQAGTSFITLKYNTEDPSSLIATLEQMWKEQQQEVPFEFSFLDEELNAAYINDQRLASLFAILTMISLFIASLGLFGLVSFTAQQRVKEIGIRKVLGASVTGIVKLLSKNFLRLVILSLIVASPIAWIAMNRWLQDFAYRIEIPFWIFIASGAAALGIALLTISFQAIKAAVANPIKNLKTE